MAYVVTVTTHHERIAALLYGAGGPVVRDARRFGNRVHAVAVRQAPRDSGLLAASGSVSVGIAPGFVFATIGFSAHYARHVMLGTGIYGPTGRPIRPVTAKALKFEAGRGIGPLRQGASHPAPGNRDVVFARKVKGSPPNPFLEDALEQVMGGVRGARILRLH